MCRDPSPVAVIREALERFRSRRPLRTGSFLVTLWGDAVEPRGGALWLASLIRIAALFGLGERLVRTTATRLAAEGWLARELHGRRSLYRTGPEGRAWIRTAARRIYAVQGAPRPFDWHLVVLPEGVPEGVRRALRWLGCGRLSGDVYVHPAPERERLLAVLAADPRAAGALVLRDPRPRADPAVLRELGRRAWRLEELEAGYRDFLRRFAPWRALDPAGLSPEDALRARLLLVHDYRRLVLADPLMPADLLPADWPGLAACRLCRDLYARLLEPSERALDTRAPETRGHAAQARAWLRARFGGPVEAAAAVA